MIELPEIVEPKTDYVANMRALWEHCPRLAVEIDRVDDSEMIACEESRRGGPTCQLMGSAGELVYLHSRYDPEREAKKWCDGVEEQAREQEDPENGRIAMCYFVDGFGLGYHVKELFDRLHGEAFIVVSEQNVSLLRTAMETADFSEMLSSDRLVVMTLANREEIFKKLQPHSNAMMLGVVFTRSLHRRDREFHEQIHTLVAEYASYLRSHLVSLLANGVATCENVLQNLPTYVGTSSIGVLQGRFRGCPAVVVSAGPSLRRNIETLKKIRDRVVVIAVQTTLKPLLGYGIVPDFVTSLDYHEVSTRFFEGLEAEELRDVHMVAEPKANWNVIDYYRGRGPISLLGNDFAQGVLRGGKDNHAELPAGATVAHLAFYLAEYIGADPIVFVGQDLGFTDNVYYSPGTALHAVWRPELNRFYTMEMKEWERIVRHRNVLRRIPDIHGQEIYTDEQMFTYLQQFEKDFAKCTARIIDASEGGTLKRYCETMPLQDVADQYCIEPIDREKYAYRDSLSEFDASKLDEGRELVLKRIEETEDMQKVVKETIELVKEMLDLLDDQPEVNRKMIRLDELRTIVKRRPSEYRLIMYVSQAAEMYRFRQDRRLELDTLEGKDRQRRQLMRDVGYVSEIDKGCDRLLQILQDCVERFDEAIAERDESC